MGYQFQKLSPGIAFHKLAAEGRGGGDAVLFLYAAHHHAQVLRFYNYAYPKRVEGFLYYVENLVSHAFLYLQATREALHHMRYFTEPGNNAIGYVGNMRFPEKR